MRFLASSVLVAGVVLCAMGGCQSEQAGRIDQAVADVNAAAQTLGPAVTTVAGPALGTIVGALTTLIGIAAATWQTLRKARVLETLGLIVNAVNKTPDETQAAVKAAVQTDMKETGNYKALNAIVDSVKA